MEGGLLLDVVVREGAAVLELLSSEDKALLVRGNSFLILNLLLHSLDGVRGLHLEGDSLAGQGLHEDLHVVGLELLKRWKSCCGWNSGFFGFVVVVESLHCFVEESGKIF